MEHEIERRKHKRFSLLTEAVAFLRTSQPHCTTAGRITNISMNGLELCHLCGKLSPEISLELDVAMSGEFDSLGQLSGKIVFDFRSKTEKIGGFSARKCGVHFEDLNDGQKSYLSHLINNHTTQC